MGSWTSEPIPKGLPLQQPVLSCGPSAATCPAEMQDAAGSLKGEPDAKGSQNCKDGDGAQRHPTGPLAHRHLGLGACTLGPISVLHRGRRCSSTRPAVAHSTRGCPLSPLACPQALGSVPPASTLGLVSRSSPGASTGCAGGPPWPCRAGLSCHGTISTLSEGTGGHDCPGVGRRWWARATPTAAPRGAGPPW